MTKNVSIYLLILVVPLLALWFCASPESQAIKNRKNSDTLLYLNHADSARYVGMNTCKLCHQGIYNTFIKTGMGKSFDVASKIKSSADFKLAHIHDSYSDYDYKSYWDKDSLMMCEYRLKGKDTTHVRREQVNYIIGSGQHTNSHLHLSNGYLSQMPMTFYTQKKKWDLPPGFEHGVNTRFSRKIGLECMSCHNAYPDFVMGSENKYTRVPQGIDCERCHGPGSIHVNLRQSGSKVDTSKYIDYSIVNPAKLPVDAQFDICQRCHLQGNAVLKDGKSFYDFKPGQKLSNYLSVFLPKYKNADDEFIMASHADRLKQSACFIKSLEKAGRINTLKPYKDALTCVSCHNPHVSVRETNKNVFNDACNRCHTKAEVETVSSKVSACKRHVIKSADCISCHMPVSGSTDIPHVSVHDHYIRRPVSKKEQHNIKTFLGLFSINEKHPDNLTKAKAYLNQYDKIAQNPDYLDSAYNYLMAIPEKEKKLKAMVQLYFVKKEYNKVIEVVQGYGEEKCFQFLVKPSFENDDAWACYRIAEAYNYTGRSKQALKWFKQAVYLAPFNLDFRNKLGATQAANGNVAESKKEFEFILQQNPEFVSAYSNLGFMFLKEGKSAEALRLYKVGEGLDPDNEALLLNLAGYFMFMNNTSEAKIYLSRILKVNPQNKQVHQLLKQLTH